MTRQERAKQFMAFDAMKGLSEALRDREERHLRCEKRELDEMESESLSRKLIQLEKGMKIRLYYYADFHDQVKDGIVTKIDKVYKYLCLNGQRVVFDNLYDIIFLESEITA